MTKPRQSLELSPEEWQALSALAKATGSTAKRGANAGNPSWRILIKRIASGDLSVRKAKK
jgi:hypothetical protein